jgi:SPP1 family predicted phage head-tail adaptor
MLRAGLLRNRITVQQRSGAVNQWNEQSPDWIDVVTLWADVRHLSGLQTIKADATASIVKASIRVRYRTDLAAGMRVLHGPAVYAVRAVLPDLQRREFVDLVCEATT